MVITVMAPTKAANRMAAKPVILTEPTDNPPPKNSITNATPSPAPLFTPNTLGPASGLRKAVCSISPLTAKAAPHRVAVIAWGSRDSRMMNCHEALAVSSPKSMLTTSPAGIDTDPSNRLSANRIATTNPKPKQYAVPLFIRRAKIQQNFQTAKPFVTNLPFITPFVTKLHRISLKFGVCCNYIYFCNVKTTELELKKLKEECYEEVEFQTDGPDGRNDDDVD